MTSSPTIQIALDCSNPHRQAAFWSATLGYEVDNDPGFIRQLLDEGTVTEDEVTTFDGELVFATGAAIKDPSDARPRWYFQKVAEGKVAKNRMHVDVQVGAENRAAEEARLVELGATRLYEGQQGPHKWTTMADPEGNEFCLS